MDRGAWRAIFDGVTKESDTAYQLNNSNNLKESDYYYMGRRFEMSWCQVKTDTSESDTKESDTKESDTIELLSIADCKFNDQFFK